MKKFLIVLTVVAMASFLLGGCNLGTTPTEVAVTDVTLTPATLALTVGGAPGTLAAAVVPATATNQSVTWASDDATVATVALGVVTPVAEGTADITVTTVDGDFTAICVVTVSAVEPAPVIGLTGIAVLPKTMDLVVGGSDTITSVTATYEIKGIPVPIALGDCTYTSSPTGIITVDDGVVTAVTPGIATITVTYGGESDTVVVTVSAVPITAIAAITGTPQVGVKLTAGALTPTAATATYQWQICDTSGGTYINITGAIEKTYTPVAGDVTKFIKVVATGTGNYSGTKTSVATTAVAAEDTSAAAIAAVRNAAVVLNYLGDYATAGDVNAFLDALADTNFTGYESANDVEYVAAVANFTSATTVASVDAAILAVNKTVTDAAAVKAVNAATTSVALNAALANTAFTGYVAANSADYFTNIALFSATLTPTVATVNVAIKAVNTAATAATAVAAVNAALTPAALNAALANAAFTGYAAVNYLAYPVASFSTILTPTVAAVDAAILVINTAEAGTAVGNYTTMAGLLGTDALIVAAVADTPLSGFTKAAATATVAALPAGTVKTAHLATIAANDVLIATAATINAVTVAAVNIDDAVLTSVTVTAVAKNAASVELTTGVTYAWTVTAAHDAAAGAYAAVIGDLVFSDATAKAPVISKALAADVGDSYEIKVVATKGGVSKDNTSTTVTVN